MNKIEHELDSLIDTKRYSCSNQKENEGYKQGVQDSYSLLEKHCVAFGKFCRELSKHNKDILRQNPDITEEQLFKLYIEQL